VLSYTLLALANSPAFFLAFSPVLVPCPPKVEIKIDIMSMHTHTMKCNCLAGPIKELFLLKLFQNSLAGLPSLHSYTLAGTTLQHQILLAKPAPMFEA
jgi:hypothetical protein